MRQRLLMTCLIAALAASVVEASTIYAVDLRASPNRFLSFDSAAPVPNVISANFPVDSYAMDFDRYATSLYAVSTAGVLGTIDLATGAFTAGPALSGVGAGENFTGLSADPLTGEMYLSTSLGGGLNILYTVDTASGVASVVAPITGGQSTELVIDIAIRGNGQMYGHDIVNDVLYEIDKVSGVLTAIGPTGLAANFAQGMDFDWSTDTLYATAYTGGGTGKFVSFDLATGAANVIADTTPWNAEMEMAVYYGIPEPATLALGLLTVALLRRR
jgi:hypothetical protein